MAAIISTQASAYSAAGTTIDPAGTDAAQRGEGRRIEPAVVRRVAGVGTRAPGPQGEPGSHREAAEQHGQREVARGLARAAVDAAFRSVGMAAGRLRPR